MLDESQMTAIKPDDERALGNGAHLEIDMFLLDSRILTAVPDAQWNQHVLPSMQEAAAAAIQAALGSAIDGDA